MIRVCYLCKRVIGEKPPLEDLSVSHGLCEGCVPVEAARIDKEISDCRFQIADLTERATGR
jgi:hypothetical protein